MLVVVAWSDDLVLVDSARFSPVLAEIGLRQAGPSDEHHGPWSDGRQDVVFGPVVKRKIKRAFCEEGNVTENGLLAFAQAVLIPQKPFVTGDAPGLEPIKPLSNLSGTRGRLCNQEDTSRRSQGEHSRCDRLFARAYTGGVPSQRGVATG
ncbi:hypothetical protein L210DRAFT_143584 [Boletus edulis BED1]|uniref:Uncharacterized protein n=1 Tax=Boletus edulis BED1 TaxID=1328754 RepID=A0AAD4C9S2_BOLED|nr:hypothetical protein L210DRAFT_143584 [Boletus edulis BED1]